MRLQEKDVVIAYGRITIKILEIIIYFHFIYENVGTH